MLLNDTTTTESHQPSPSVINRFLPWIMAGLFLLLLSGINRFPITFTDFEAAPMVYAEEMLLNHFQFRGSEPFPAYFSVDFPMDMGVLVYLSMLPLVSLGKHIWVVRLISICAALLSMWWTYKIARDHLHLQAAPLIFFLFGAVPGWIILSRSGNSAIIRCAGYSAFIYYYLEYRFKNRKSIYNSFFAALVTFYSDFFGQELILISSVFLLVFDFRYHWVNKKKFLFFLGVCLLSVLPWVRYLVLHPQSYSSLLTYFQPEWLQKTTFLGKVAALGKSLLNGFLPMRWENTSFSWFGGNYFPVILFVFTITGFFIAIIKRKHPVLLWVMLFSPFFTILFAPASLNSLAAGIPAYLLFVCISLNGFIEFFPSKYFSLKKRLPELIAVVLFGLGVFSGFRMVQLQKNWVETTINQPVQYGGKQIFNQINRFSTIHPDKQFILTTVWCNHPDLLHDFFLKDKRNIQFNLLDQYINQYKKEIQNTIFLLDQNDLKKIHESNKFSEPHILTTIPYPDGSPAYYFSELSYMINIEDKIREEQTLRNEKQQVLISWLNQTVTVSYPQLSAGPVFNLFDGNEETLVRTDQVNPLSLSITFENPVNISMLRFLMGQQELEVFLTLTPAESQPTLQYSTLSGASTENKFIQFSIEPSQLIKKIELTIKNENETENNSIELWEIEAN